MPWTLLEKKERAKKILNNICKKCSKEMSMDENDPCFECFWKKLIDEIMEA